MNILIRNEEQKDYRRVEEITRDAFWNLYFPGCTEHFLAHEIRNHPDFIPELTFVIEVDGQIVGSIFYSYSKVVDSEGKEHQTLSFGPVSILPGLQRHGLGRALISHSIEAARQAGHKAIIIAGFPYHYQPYGFEGAKKYKISMPDGKYYKCVMALPLFEGALDDVHGTMIFSKGMYPDLSKLEDFDQQFPAKEKMITESQKQFEKAAGEIDD